MPNIGTTRVEDIMVTNLISVEEIDSIEKVAKVFREHDINAAPVTNKLGKCVGIITSHDIVEYESVRKAMHAELSHGSAYDIAHYSSGMDIRMPGVYFDEASFHMTKTFRTASVDDPLSRVAKDMCARHIHHVLVLDESEKAIGMLSSLDILGFVTGEPVCRSASYPSSMR